jgi:hypothetical protein
MKNLAKGMKTRKNRKTFYKKLASLQQYAVINAAERS